LDIGRPTRSDASTERGILTISRSFRAGYGACPRCTDSSHHTGQTRLWAHARGWEDAASSYDAASRCDAGCSGGSGFGNSESRAGCWHDSARSLHDGAPEHRCDDSSAGRFDRAEHGV
jgi:hypothetical protein